MSVSTRLVKDPDDRLDYVVDYGQFWLPEGDFIVDASVLSDKVTITIFASTFTNTHHSIWLDGGNVGETYRITSRIETNDGRKRDFTFPILIRER